MATTKNFKHRVTNLSARIQAHLHQFEPVDSETDYSPVSRPEQKKKNPYLRAGMAAGAVGGAVAIGTNKDRIAAAGKDAYGRAKTAAAPALASAKKTGRRAVFRGMQRGADVAESGMRAANKAGATKVGGLLGDVAKKVSKKSMAFFNADLASTLIRLEAKVGRLGA